MDDGPAQPSVCALVGGVDERMEGALAAQRRPPRTVVRDPGGLRAGLERALDTGADWVWVLDGTAAPAPDSLAALLDALEDAAGLPAPVVLAGVVLDSNGRADRGRGVWFHRDRADLALAAAERRLLPVRATAAPALVARGAAESELPARRARLGPSGVFEWTARLLREGAGYLVPAAESRALRTVRDPAGDPLSAIRLLRGRALSGREKLVLGYKLAERAGEWISAPAAAARPPGRRSAS
ncbi:MAG TPA: hypothetical protein VF545_10615 [Thermoleophilaceae bacterium]